MENGSTGLRTSTDTTGFFRDMRGTWVRRTGEQLLRSRRPERRRYGGARRRMGKAPRKSVVCPCRAFACDIGGGRGVRRPLAERRGLSATGWQETSALSAEDNQ